MNIKDILEQINQGQIENGTKYNTLFMPFRVEIEYDGEKLIDTETKEAADIDKCSRLVFFKEVERTCNLLEGLTDIGHISDPYMDEERVLLRLKEEYIKHGKLIIAYDFDYTINNYRDEDWEYERVIRLLKDWKDKAIFICYTASAVERYDEIRNKINELGIPLDYLNENVPNPNLPQGVKLFYNILLDDRSGLGECYRVLRKILTELNEEIDKSMYKSIDEVENCKNCGSKMERRLNKSGLSSTALCSNSECRTKAVSTFGYWCIKTTVEYTKLSPDDYRDLTVLINKKGYFSRVP